MEGNNYSLSFRRMWEKNLRFFLKRIFGCDFLSPRTTIFSGIENYPSASISCCSDNLAQLLPCLDLWSLWSEVISPRINFSLYCKSWLTVSDGTYWVAARCATEAFSTTGTEDCGLVIVRLSWLSGRALAAQANNSQWLPAFPLSFIIAS